MSTSERNNSPRLMLLERMPKTSICAEIGVWKGEFSRLILSETNPKLFHLIDPWEFQPEFSERMYGGSVAKSQRDMDVIYHSVRQLFDNEERVIFNKDKSDKILESFEDNYFDWLYIDGNHYYDYVLQDLEISLRKVKVGGIIAGDDYTWGAQYDFPVRRAVEDFTQKNGLSSQLSIIQSQYLIQL